MLAGGCGSPSAANIELRKENQTLRDETEALKRAREADALTIKALQAKSGIAPAITHDRIEKLFTAQGLLLGRLTGGMDEDRHKPGDEGMKVYVVPTDQDNEPVKAAGSFVIEAFDLAAADPAVGKWTFDVDAAKKSWTSALMLYHYVLKCPWQRLPVHNELTVKITFTDELTGRVLHVQKIVKVNLPPKETTAGSR